MNLAYTELVHQNVTFSGYNPMGKGEKQAIE